MKAKNITNEEISIIGIGTFKAGETKDLCNKDFDRLVDFPCPSILLEGSYNEPEKIIEVEVPKKKQK